MATLLSVSLVGMAAHMGHQHHFEQGSQVTDTTGLGAASTVGSSSAPSMMHMHMTFYWGPNVTLLFSSWTSSTWMQYSLVLLLCFVATLAVEALATYRSRMILRIKHNPKYRSLRPRAPASGSADSIAMPM